MNDQRWRAAIGPSPEDPVSRVIILDNDEVLSPADADFGEFSIVEATAEERAALAQSGYALPDWKPVTAPSHDSTGS